MLSSQTVDEVNQIPQTLVPIRSNVRTGASPVRSSGLSKHTDISSDRKTFRADAQEQGVEAVDAGHSSDAVGHSLPDNIRSDEDRQLLRLLAGGETEAFWVLWLRHRKYLFSICLKRLPSAPEDAEDVLSRAMIRALEKLPSQAWRIENAKAWLARLTINLCVDAYRERKRRTAGCENVEDVAQFEAHPAVCSTQSPEQSLLRDELRNRVRGAVEDLPVHIKRPFVLHFVDDFPCKDVGEQLFLTPENVRKRIQRARSLLKKRLSPYLNA